MSMIAYQVFRIALAAAGSQPFIQQVGLVHVVEFQDGNGDPVLDGMIECAVGEGSSQYVPLRYNSKIALPETVSKVQFRWAAQSDTYAIVLFSPEPRKLTADTPPTRQLVTTSVGSDIAIAPVAIDDTATEVTPADITRQSVSIYNAGPDACEIIQDASGAYGDGMPLPAGSERVIDDTTAAVFAICDTGGTAELRVMVQAS